MALLDRSDPLGVTLMAEPGLTVEAEDLSGSGTDFTHFSLGPIDILGALDDIRVLATRLIAKCDQLDAARIVAAEHGCTDGGHGHALSPVEDLGNGAQVVECIACTRQFVHHPDGTLSPVVSTAVAP